MSLPLSRRRATYIQGPNGSSTKTARQNTMNTLNLKSCALGMPQNVGLHTYTKVAHVPLGGTAKHLKIGRLKSVLPENLLIRQLSDLAFGSRFVYNCPSACFSEINIVPRTAPSTQCQQKKVTSIHVLGRSFIRMKCLAAFNDFNAKPQATPYRQ